MTQEERNLLIQDLCARFPYGVIAKKEYTFVFTNGTISKSKEIEKIDLEDIEYLISGDDCIDVLKPYLRPMSSMTDEEREEYRLLGGVMSYNPAHNTYAVAAFSPEAYDWLNKNMFDYRGLIPKGLALKAKEGMYGLEAEPK
jgi:hypothetical protein